MAAAFKIVINNLYWSDTFYDIRSFAVNAFNGKINFLTYFQIMIK